MPIKAKQKAVNVKKLPTKVKINLSPPKPRFEFSPAQLEACKKSKLIADRLIKMQVKGKFNYGYTTKDKKPLKSYNLTQHFLTAAALTKMSETHGHNFDPYQGYHFVNCIIAADATIQWALKKYMQPVKDKAMPEPKLISKLNKFDIDATAAALLSVCGMVNYMMRNKYSMMVTWRLENHMHYVNQGYSLAQGLHMQIKKDGNVAAKCQVALLLKALFAWVGVSQSLFAWYNNLKSDKFVTYKARPILYETLSIYSKKKDEDFVAPLAMALRNVGECEAYRVKFLPRIKNLLKVAKNNNNLLAATIYFGIYSSQIYKIDNEKIMKKVEARLQKTAKQIKSTGSVAKDGKVSIAVMQDMLTQLHDFASFKPYYA